MKYFYKLDENNIVTEVTFAEDNFSAAGWHATPLDTKIGVGCILNDGIFYPPSPFPSWVMDGAGDWLPPTPKPSVDENVYSVFWNESNSEWLVIDKESEYYYHLEEIERLGWLDHREHTDS